MKLTHITHEGLTLDDIPPAKYIIEGLEFATGTLNMIVGTGNSGKSLFCQDLLMAVSANDPEQKILNMAIQNPGRVLHFDFEQNEKQTMKRNLRIMKYRSIKSTDYDQVRDIDCSWDVDFSVMSKTKDWLIDACKDSSLVMIDSLSKISSKDENSTEMKHVLKMLHDVAEKTDTCILIIHHDGKGNNEKIKQKGRGSTAIYDNLDCQWQLLFDRESKVYTLKNTKARECELKKSITFKLIESREMNMKHNKSESIGFELCKKIAHTEVEEEIVELLKTNKQLNFTKMKENISIKEETLRSIILEMVNKHLLKLEDGGKGKAKLYSLNGAHNG